MEISRKTTKETLEPIYFNNAFYNWRWCLCPPGLFLFHFSNFPKSGFSVVLILTVSAPGRCCRFYEIIAFTAVLATLQRGKRNSLSAFFLNLTVTLSPLQSHTVWPQRADINGHSSKRSIPIHLARGGGSARGEPWISTQMDLSCAWASDSPSVKWVEIHCPEHSRVLHSLSPHPLCAWYASLDTGTQHLVRHIRCLASLGRHPSCRWIKTPKLKKKSQELFEKCIKCPKQSCPVQSGSQESLWSLWKGARPMAVFCQHKIHSEVWRLSRKRGCKI